MAWNIVQKGESGFGGNIEWKMYLLFQVVPEKRGILKGYVKNLKRVLRKEEILWDVYKRQREDTAFP